MKSQEFISTTAAKSPTAFSLENHNSHTLKGEYWAGSEGLTPVIFLSGYRSDMKGTKAEFLMQAALAENTPFLRFDYSGHGISGGVFDDLLLSDWIKDTALIIDFALTLWPQSKLALCGSSMGGWIALKMAMDKPQSISHLYGIAPAPDFTRDMQARLTSTQKEALIKQGFILEENPYGPPYRITKAFLNDGEQHCLLDKKLDIPQPISLLQGMEDEAVHWQKALKIQSLLRPHQAKITLIPQGDHRLSSPSDLKALKQGLAQLLQR